MNEELLISPEAVEENPIITFFFFVTAASHSDVFYYHAGIKITFQVATCCIRGKAVLLTPADYHQLVSDIELSRAAYVSALNCRDNLINNNCTISSMRKIIHLRVLIALINVQHICYRY